jgi:hypothetical protein
MPQARERAIISFGGAAYLVSRDEDITRSPDLAHQLELHGIRSVPVRQFLREIESA